MWAGISLKDFEESVYHNFYTDPDIEIIRGSTEVALSDVKRLINKADKIGDMATLVALEMMYDELLCAPPMDYPPLPPRTELVSRYNEMIDQSYQKLFLIASLSSG